MQRREVAKPYLRPQGPGTMVPLSLSCPKWHHFLADIINRGGAFGTPLSISYRNGGDDIAEAEK